MEGENTPEWRDKPTQRHGKEIADQIAQVSKTIIEEYCDTRGLEFPIVNIAVSVKDDIIEGNILEMIPMDKHFQIISTTLKEMGLDVSENTHNDFVLDFLSIYSDNYIKHAENEGK